MFGLLKSPNELEHLCAEAEARLLRCWAMIHLWRALQACLRHISRCKLMGRCVVKLFRSNLFHESTAKRAHCEFVVDPPLGGRGVCMLTRNMLNNLSFAGLGRVQVADPWPRVGLGLVCNSKGVVGTRKPFANLAS
jgi:hypothetical protein